MVLVGAEGAALLQHGVHQRGLAVVHVRDDGDVANARTQNGFLPDIVYYYFTMRGAVRRRDAPHP